MGHKTWAISKQPQRLFYNFIKENLAQVLFWHRCTYFEEHLQMTASGLALVSHRSLQLYSCFNLKCISRVFLWILQNIFSQQKSVELLLPIIFLYSNCKYIPSRRLLVQRKQWRHQSNVWNLFKVKNKDIRTASLTFC